jgi:hypothetical protein
MRFRTMSVAKSTTNRILNIADDLARERAQQRLDPVQTSPVPPDPTQQGAALDAALSTPTPPVEGDPGLAQAVVADGLGLASP